MNTLIAVTGGAGFVGNMVCIKLLEQGYRIRALIHSNELRCVHPNIESLHGDIRNLDDIKKLCEGCDHVIHIAAYISIVSHEKKKLQSINIEGTRNIIACCMELNIPLVYVSSVEAIGKQGEHIHSEDDSFSTAHALIYYGESKAQASLEVLEATKKGLHAVIVCPAGIVGPFDHDDSKLGIMVKDFLAKKLPAYPSKGGFCFVDIRDVAQAIIVAMDKGRTGAYYIVTSEYIETADLMTLLEEISGVRKPLLSVPLWLMYVTAIFIEPICRILRINPIYTKGTVRILASRLHFKSNILKEEFGIVPRSLKESFIDQVAWCRGEEVSF